MRTLPLIFFAVAGRALELNLGSPHQFLPLDAGASVTALFEHTRPVGQAAPLVFDLASDEPSAFSFDVSLLGDDGSEARTITCNDAKSLYWPAFVNASAAFRIVISNTQDNPTSAYSFTVSQQGVAGILPYWTAADVLHGNVQSALYIMEDGQPATVMGFKLAPSSRGYSAHVSAPKFPTQRTTSAIVAVGSSPDNLAAVSGSFAVQGETFVTVTMKPSGLTCPWVQSSDQDGMSKCADGQECSYAKDPTCCDGHGGISRCPKDASQMCDATHNAMACGGAYCCSRDCEAYLNLAQRACFAAFTMTFDPEPEPVTPAHGSDVSTGAVFLMLFISAVATYCGCGMVFQWMHGARECPELMPHYTFWTEVPLFVRDGWNWLWSSIFGARPSKYFVFGGEYAPVPRDFDENSDQESMLARDRGGDYGTESAT
ncbi:hypothetical protein DIPPA_04408 [Diplonema papillatum]|nr:hypothetical protein DIPPA_04408 [Diplonema papillatum]